MIFKAAAYMRQRQNSLQLPSKVLQRRQMIPLAITATHTLEAICFLTDRSPSYGTVSLWDFYLAITDVAHVEIVQIYFFKCRQYKEPVIFY
ncbi:MAG: hypothetical protein EBS82_03040 [Methylocystaceae bacterium]|nr:hypothetical protein [Methylocystaceae bacterium]NBT22551.1 hypothetical protein [Methylocystaceae bacterium]